MKEQRTAIHPEILDEYLASAKNAAAKGQSQFETPAELGERLSDLLPPHRPAIVDLNCGSGKLLRACSNATTLHRYGVDIDPSAVSGFSKISHDLTLLYSMMVDVGWTAPVFVLNPPWDMHWHRHRLEALSESRVDAVRLAWQGHDPRVGRDAIDSTIATLMIALDRGTPGAEGLLIANNATLDRLIFNEGAPHAALASHVWLRLTLDGNAVTGDERIGYDHQQSEFKTGVLFFCRSHLRGPSSFESLRDLKPELRSLRCGILVGTPPDATHHLWDAMRKEVANRRADRPAFHLSLAGGHIRTHLSVYEQHSATVRKRDAAALKSLDGRSPMDLVHMRAERELLLSLVGIRGKTPWTVDPALVAAVHEALREYHAHRAPLYPLNRIQRIGYLDEADTIHCLKDLGPFKRGCTYALDSSTHKVTRQESRPNLIGEAERIDKHGSELAITIGSGSERSVFMDVDPKDKKITIEPATEVHFNLQALADHFEIPEVTDVSAVQPDLYQERLERIDQLEALIASIPPPPPGNAPARHAA